MDIDSSVGIANVLLLLTAGVNFGLSILLFLRSRENTQASMFSFVLLFTSFWSVSMYFQRTLILEMQLVKAYLSTMTFGLLLSVSLMFFSYHFPYKSSSPSIAVKTVVYAGILVVLLLIYGDPGFIIEIVQLGGWTQPVVKQSTYGIYSLFLALIFTVTIINLTRRFFVMGGAHRAQLKWALTGIGFAIIAGTIFDVILVLFGDYSLNWVGPISSLVMSFIVMKLLVYSHRK